MTDHSHLYHARMTVNAHEADALGTAGDAGQGALVREEERRRGGEEKGIGREERKQAVRPNMPLSAKSQTLVQGLRRAVLGVEAGNDGRRASPVVLAVTASTSRAAQAYADILRRHVGTRSSASGRVAAVLAVPDPSSSAAPGSGGATLNALLSVAEFLSARAADTSINTAHLEDQRIIVLHFGRTSPLQLSLGWVPTDHLPPVSFLEVLVSTLLESPLAPGALVCSAEAAFLVPPGTFRFLGHEGDAGSCEHRAKPTVSLFTVPASPAAVCARHGVYTFDPETLELQDLLYRPSQEQLPPGATANMVCGVVHLNVPATQKLVALSMYPPLDACTQLGHDEGATPAYFSLYLDFVRALSTQGAPAGSQGRASAAVREVLWDPEFRTSFHTRVVQLAHPLHYLYTVSPHDFYEIITHPPKPMLERIALDLGPGAHTRVAQVVNASVSHSETKVGQRSAILHSIISGAWTLGDGCLVAGVRDDCLGALDGVRVPSGTILYQAECDLPQPQSGGAAHGASSSSSSSTTTRTTSPSSSAGLRHVLVTTVIRPHQEHGTSIVCDPASSSTAVLDHAHAVLHVLAEGEPPGAACEVVPTTMVNAHIAIAREVEWRTKVTCAVDLRAVHTTLISRTNVCLRGAYARLATAREWRVLDLLDSIAQDTSQEGHDLDVGARALAHMADALAAFIPEGQSGLRSGPARNAAFEAAYAMLEDGHVREAVAEMRSLRQAWLFPNGRLASRGDELPSPHALLRAARHYEGAAGVLTRLAVGSARSAIAWSTTLPRAHGAPAAPAACRPPRGGGDGNGDGWWYAESGVRIDVAGGWTDTPPIAFEHGGAVTNVAILLNGKRPIGCRARRLPAEPGVLRFRTLRGAGPAPGLTYSDAEHPAVTCVSFADLRDCGKPSAPAALLKAAVLCAGLLPDKSRRLDSAAKLSEALPDFGIEAESWSDVPLGSGLGTSSILAGCVLAALRAAAFGSAEHGSNSESLVHAVLMVEQTLTTGGGWQDQVGGLLPGAKIARSPGRLPLRVDSTLIHTPAGFPDVFRRHVVVAFSGRARLARNLLQDVLRRWYARLPEIVATTDALVENAERARDAFARGDVLAVGACLREYWSHKKRMADGCEPPEIARIFGALRDAGLLCGEALCGAGGGGFVVLVSAEPDAKADIVSVVSRMPEGGALKFFDVEMDTEGLSVFFTGGE